MILSEILSIEVNHSSDVNLAARKGKAICKEAGFSAQETEEIALAVKELASNLVKYADQGVLVFKKLEEGGQTGIQIESIDQGPGIADVEEAFEDGFSTGGSLGVGLGTVNRLMDEVEITTHSTYSGGTHIVCKRLQRVHKKTTNRFSLDVGAHSRPLPGHRANGDAFVIKEWENQLFVSLIDGVGHGRLAYQAAQKACNYLLSHYDQPFENIIRGLERTCRSSRGVVLLMLRFDLERHELVSTGIGNIETRITGTLEPDNIISRRGIVGLNKVSPVVRNHHWESDFMMILHSDGIETHRANKGDNFANSGQPASEISRQLLHSFSKDSDDATVIVIKKSDYA